MNELRDFLKKKKILTRFKKNMIHFENKEEWIERHRDDKEAIGAAFIWGQTKENHMFWKDIGKEWSNGFE